MPSYGQEVFHKENGWVPDDVSTPSDHQVPRTGFSTLPDPYSPPHYSPQPTQDGPRVEACFRCQIRKKKCQKDKPCSNCEGAADGPEDCTSYGWMSCFVLALSLHDPFTIDCPIEAGISDFHFGQQVPWILDSPLKVLGQANANNAPEASGYLVPTTTAFSERLRRCFGIEFVVCYTFLVDPNITAMIKGAYYNTAYLHLLNSATTHNVSWEMLAIQRARCGTFVLQYFMENLFKRDNKTYRVFNTAEEYKWPTFLVIVGTLIATKATRDLPYVTSHELMKTTTQDLVERLAHCMILLGNCPGWDFMRYKGPKRDLQRWICDPPGRIPNDTLISIIDGIS